MKVEIARRALIASVLAVRLTPQPATARSAIGAFGAKECRTDECRERVAATPTELESSPLIEELKRRSKENAESNARSVKAITSAANGGVINDAAPDYYTSVRYDGVTRILDKQQIKELKSQGFELSCPKQAGFPCTLVEAPPPAASPMLVPAAEAPALEAPAVEASQAASEGSNAE